MNKSLLMLNMSYKRDWDKGIVNRNYHLLHTIIQQKGFEHVLYCDFIPFSFRTTVKTLLLGRPWKKNSTTVYRRWHTRIDRSDKKNAVYHIVTVNQRYLEPALSALNIATSNTILWSYTPFTSSLFEQQHWALTLFDAVDNWSEHPSFQGEKKELTEHYTRIRRNADVITTVSESLVDFFEKKEHVYFIPNGVDARHFSTAVCNAAHLPDAVQHSHPRIGYHGIIQSRLNFPMLQYIADHRPEWQILLAGPVWKEVQPDLNDLLTRTNVHYLGPVPYKDLPTLISCFDCAIIPHRIDTLTQTMNPLKIYEYLAAGLPIVSTPVPGTEQFQDLLTTVVSPEECIHSIETMLSQNSVQLKERRKHMAEQHSWNSRWNTISSIIQRHLTNETSTTTE